MLIAMFAWRTGKMAIFELPKFVEKTEGESVDYVRAFGIGQLVHQFERNTQFYDTQKKRVRLAIVVLGITVANVGVFIAAAALAVTTVCG